MKFLIILNAFLFLVSSCDVNADHIKWKEHLGKHGHRINKRIHKHCDNFHNEEVKQKYSYFLRNMERVRVHNEELKTHRKHTYKKDLNQYAHYSFEEFQKKYLMTNVTVDISKKKYKKFRMVIKNNFKTLAMRVKSDKLKTLSAIKMKQKEEEDYELFIDWSRTGCIGDVKDQGACGSCYAETTTSTVESAVCISEKIRGKRSIVESLSRQHVIDCSFENTADALGRTYSNQGCTGGNLEEAFRYMKNNGLLSAQTYPSVEYNPAVGDYSGFVDECKYNKKNGTSGVPFNSSTVVYIESYESIFDFRDMIRALRMGPLATYVYVSENMYAYDSGIISADPMCERIGKAVNHAVLIVGFGEENGIYFWKIKNSWGTAWGEDGYFRMSIGINLCNIEMQAVYPRLE